VNEWATQGFIVSFKLETDPSLLVPKARTALARYGHQVVVGNLLSTRKEVVWFVGPDSDAEEMRVGTDEVKARVEELRLGKDEVKARVEELRLGKDEVKAGVEIERDIVGELVRRHSEWIKAHASTGHA
jgi:phosphopantothenate---cysteine ligase (ATP)